MASVRYDQATRIFPKASRPAVDSLSLDIADGEFLVLVGPSGCGKSTSLRMLAGLEEVDAGSVWIGEREMNLVPPKSRDVAMVFQNYALYPHMTVAENIGFALKLAHMPKKEIRARVIEAAAMLDLDEYLERKPRSLSGGQRQRVAMGRAIVRRPQVFLLDEPLSNLDAKLREQTRTQIASLQRRLGVTTVYVTHDQVEAMTMGDRVAVLNDGVLQQYGTARELYDQPVNVFVASFIGSPEMNLYEAALDPSGALVLGSQQLKLGQLPPGLAARSGGTVIVGIRPEELTLSSPGAPGSLAADVRAVQPLGSEVDVLFAIDAAAAGARAQAAASGESDTELFGETYNGVARLDPRAAPRPGERVTFTVDVSRLHFFDPDTGRAMS